MNLYPRSFLRLIVLGNVLTALPLLAAITYASLTIDDLTQRSEEVVRQALQIATLGHTLQEELNQMERTLRQYEVLHDPSLLDEYGVLRQELRRNLDAYSAMPLLAPLGNQVHAIKSAETSAFDAPGTGAQRLGRLKDFTASARNDLRPLLDEANRLVTAERLVFRSKSEELRQNLVASLLTALAFTWLMVWFGRRTIARLWSRFERIVLALGEGRLDRRIKFPGPEDMQRVGERLEWLRTRLLTLERERTRVMRHASHELKTPLATLREGASLLSEGIAGALTPRQAKITAIMQTNALRLQQLIDGMLRMQQASHARDHMEAGPIRLDKVIAHTLATLRLAVRDRQVRITGSLAPLTVTGNHEALATLVNNLISNAIKFSPDGGVVRVMLTREDNNAVLDVTDEGPGIDAKDRERIFEPFYRGSASKNIAGVGLGLAIAHEFVLAHRGTLEIVTSERGAHFRACLPLMEQTAP
ncbi:MAG: HAMP domain-containing sensor histidine kinase [Rugosibacter sp.]|nr:HAMP domain-containing sensor histidine kinase [Rugosibacter sp.]